MVSLQKPDWYASRLHAGRFHTQGTQNLFRFFKTSKFTQYRKLKVKELEH